jgi:hypothetical protein
MEHFPDKPEPIPSATLLVPWIESKLRRTVMREEWVGCWKTNASGYLEFFDDGTARQKIIHRGTSGDFQGTITWEWIDPRLIRISRQPVGGDELVDELRVIRYDGKKMWTEGKCMDGLVKGIELSLFLIRAPRPKSWR